MQVLSTDQNIFDLPDAPHTAVCVTTNGIVKRNGQAVMGKGIAKEADMRFHVSDLLGKKLSVALSKTADRHTDWSHFQQRTTGGTTRPSNGSPIRLTN